VLTILVNSRYNVRVKIHIPNSAFIGNIDQFIAGFDDDNPSSLEITTNDRWISMHPVVLCMIAALATKPQTETISIDEVTATSGHYLTRMGLYNFLGIPSPHNIEEHDPAGRFIPLTQITSSTELSNFLNDMVPMLHIPPVQARSIRYIMSELIRNVLEHAFTTTGAMVAAQYYKKTNTIRIGIVDTGIGIKSSMAPTYNPKDDLTAIKYALMPGVTGTTLKEGGTDYNAGAGLFFIKSIAAINEDPFLIYSGNSMFKLLKNKRKKLNWDPSTDNHSEKENLPTWNGTVVGIDINLNSTAAFTSLLKLIQDTYTEAVRERKKERYRKARFI